MADEKTTNENLKTGDVADEVKVDVEVTPSADDPVPAQKTDDKTLTQADFDKALAKQKKAWEKQVADAEARAKLSETERTKAEADDLRAQLRDRDARDSVKDAAAKLGVKNPTAIYKIVAGDLEFDDGGQISNLNEILDTAKTDFPELFDTKPKSSIDGGAGSDSPTTGNSLDNQIRKLLGYR